LFENVFCKTIAFMILWLQIMLQSALDT
jgi:hypothetical protein